MENTRSPIGRKERDRIKELIIHDVTRLVCGSRWVWWGVGGQRRGWRGGERAGGGRGSGGRRWGVYHRVRAHSASEYELRTAESYNRHEIVCAAVFEENSTARQSLRPGGRAHEFELEIERGTPTRRRAAGEGS